MPQDESRIDHLREQFAKTPLSRAHDRLQFEAPVSVEILIPEDTFRPQSFKGFTLNISEKGMQVALELLGSELYSKMLMRQRMARVALTHPATGRDMNVLGRIAWIDFRKSQSGQKAGDCCLGLTFSEKDGVNLSEYSKLVDDAKRMLRRGAPGVVALD